MIVQITAKDFDEQPELTSDEIIKGEVEYSQWQHREDMWWASKERPGSKENFKIKG